MGHGKSYKIQIKRRASENERETEEHLRFVSPLINDLTRSSVNRDDGVLFDGTESLRIEIGSIRKGPLRKTNECQCSVMESLVSLCCPFA